jgi:hypothetical protein
MVPNIPDTQHIISSSHLKRIQGIRVPVEEEPNKPPNLCVSGLVLIERRINGLFIFIYPGIPIIFNKST